MTPFPISGHLFHQKMRLFRNFFISQRIKLQIDTGIQNWMPSLIFGSKSGFGDNFGQYETKTIILCRFWPNHS